MLHECARVKKRKKENTNLTYKKCQCVLNHYRYVLCCLEQRECLLQTVELLKNCVVAQAAPLLHIPPLPGTRPMTMKKKKKVGS